jgi:hypothetical protein
MIKKLLIIGMEPAAMESPTNIRTADIFIKSNSQNLRAFVPNWDVLPFRVGLWRK